MLILTLGDFPEILITAGAVRLIRPRLIRPRLVHIQNLIQVQAATIFHSRNASEEV